MIAAAGAAGSAPAPDVRVAGLPLRRRIELAATRAHLRPVLASELDAQAKVEEADAANPAAMERRRSGQRRIIVCPANVIPQQSWLHALARMPMTPDTLWVDDSLVAMVETEDLGKVLAEAARARSAAELVGALGERFPRAPLTVDPRGRFVLARPGDLRSAETWLLRHLVKDAEGFMSRHFERRISLALTRRLVKTSITPNVMTLVSLSVGLGSAPFFLSPKPGWQLAGALLFLLHSILDGCDGEIARLKFLESRVGALLDFWGDNVVHVTVFGCMAVGWSLARDSILPVLLGVAAIGAVGVASAVLSGYGFQPKPPGPDTTAARVVDALANRDFIYLVLALSIVGRAWWFVAFVATGTPIFVLAALWANRDRRAG